MFLIGSKIETSFIRFDQSAGSSQRVTFHCLFEEPTNQYKAWLYLLEYIFHGNPNVKLNELWFCHLLMPTMWESVKQWLNGKNSG